MNKDMEKTTDLIKPGDVENYQTEIMLHSLLGRVEPIKPLPPLTEEQRECLNKCRTFRKYKISQSFPVPDLPQEPTDELFSLVPKQDAEAFVKQMNKTCRRHTDAND